jgi:hypothetical protein
VKFKATPELMEELNLDSVQKAGNRDKEVFYDDHFNPNIVESGEIVDISMCIDCFNTNFNAIARYCKTCDYCVIPEENETCPFCNGITEKDVPDEWRLFLEKNPMRHPLVYVADPDFIPSKENVEEIIQLLIDNNLYRADSVDNPGNYNLDLRGEHFHSKEALDLYEWNGKENIHIPLNIGNWRIDKSLEDTFNDDMVTGDEQYDEPEEEYEDYDEEDDEEDDEDEETYLNYGGFTMDIIGDKEKLREGTYDDRGIQYAIHSIDLEEFLEKTDPKMISRLVDEAKSRFFILKDIYGIYHEAKPILGGFVKYHSELINKMVEILGKPIKLGYYGYNDEFFEFWEFDHEKYLESIG